MSFISGGYRLEDLFEYGAYTAQVRNIYANLPEEDQPNYLDPSPPPSTGGGGGGGGGGGSPGTPSVTASDIAYVPAKTSLNGVRSDLPEGNGVRVRIGELSDGSLGLERYLSNGTRQTITWS
jgi:hypothetical protein